MSLEHPPSRWVEQLELFKKAPAIGPRSTISAEGVPDGLLTWSWQRITQSSR
jgi:hypothetical protein